MGNSSNRDSNNSNRICGMLLVMMIMKIMMDSILRWYIKICLEVIRIIEMILNKHSKD